MNEGLDDSSPVFTSLNGPGYQPRYESAVDSSEFQKSPGSPQRPSATFNNGSHNEVPSSALNPEVPPLPAFGTTPRYYFRIMHTILSAD